MMIGNARAAARLVGLIVAVALLAVTVASVSAAQTVGQSKLCASLIPPKRALPPALRAAGMSNYTLPLSPNAQAHHALCSVGLSSPSDGYRYNVGWDVFPSHALAAADFTSYPVSALYNGISVDRPASGFPSPNFAVVGAGKLTGKPVSVIAFVDGPTIVSAYIYGASDALAAVSPIARWAVQEIKAIEHPTVRHASK
jgi:hypothetical protein